MKSLEPVRTPTDAPASMREPPRSLPSGLRGRAFDDAAIGMAVIAPTGRWQSVNAALCEMLGYGELELRQKTFQELTHPEDLFADVEQLRALSERQTSGYELEKRFVRRDGSAIWVLERISAVADNTGAVVQFICQVQDITNLHRAEEARRRAEDVLRTVVANAPIMLWAIDRDGRFTVSEGRGLEALGLLPGQIVEARPSSASAPRESWSRRAGREPAPRRSNARSPEKR
jgi:PAS domain S-box-containing protein